MISDPKSKPRPEVRYAGWHGRRRLLEFGRFFRLPRLTQRRSRLQACSPFVVERCADCPDDTKWMDRLALRFGGRYRILDRGSGGAQCCCELRGRCECHNWSSARQATSRSAMQAPLLWRACRNRAIVLLSTGQWWRGCVGLPALSPVPY